MATIEARVSETLVTCQSALEKAKSSLVEEQRVTPERARATITQYKESPGFKLGLQKMGRVYEYGYWVALVRFWVRYPKLEIKEDLYAALLEDDNVPMEEEVSFD
ncbi:hypothetical protein BHM03_00023555 [Ensete ventricosum]|nr:hypothetical protein BHM03_00023555 [Ensete ventricosum]